MPFEGQNAGHRNSELLDLKFFSWSIPPSSPVERALRTLKCSQPPFTPFYTHFTHIANIIETPIFNINRLSVTVKVRRYKVHSSMLKMQRYINVTCSQFFYISYTSIAMLINMKIINIELPVPRRGTPQKSWINSRNAVGIPLARARSQCWTQRADCGLEGSSVQTFG